MNTVYEILKNRLHSGVPFDYMTARTRIEALANGLAITQAQADELHALAEANASVAVGDYNARLAAVEQTAGVLNEVGLTKTRSQSDKLGSDFVVYTLGDVVLRRDYAPQERPAGTAESPIVFTETVPLIPNAYYVHADERKVWTGEATVGASWEDARWEAF